MIECGKGHTIRMPEIRVPEIVGKNLPRLVCWACVAGAPPIDTVYRVKVDGTSVLLFDHGNTIIDTR
jgi:hypothetical protein